MEIAVFARQIDHCLSKHVRATVIANVRINGLENRQGFTAFVSSNLTLSAKYAQVEKTARWLPPAAGCRPKHRHMNWAKLRVFARAEGAL